MTGQPADFDWDRLSAELRAELAPAAPAYSRVPRPVGVPTPEWWAPEGPRLRMADWDLIIANDSGGKDGEVALGRAAQQAADEGVLDRLVVQYNRLGKRVSWPGTAEMGSTAKLLMSRFGDRPGSEGTARLHAEHYGLRFEVTEREHEQDGDLLDQIERYGKFPSDNRRFCTSDWKRGPGKKLITRLVKELGVRGRPARVLYVFGFRAQESTRRGRLPVLRVDEQHSSRNREITEWFPVHHWTEDQVWSEIHRSGVPYCWPYDAGMRRLSCRFCVLAGGEDLTLAAALSQDVAQEYLAVEERNVTRGLADGDMRSRTFQKHRSMADIIAAAQEHPILSELRRD
ncbi:phosphoadenosine phosphosulfate reductase family protein [Micromonospora sp. RV43]|uniref:phosphoadenosine phosphosulfate reductase domain-containing protein n=1 Tax=Micromonospora sp. RV43 TaxID=1661387 RepID=UPI00069D18A0|nr:phosphoadenosine phosphosulfate reductase family protein [Micromonospora sp. RV43]